MKGGKRGEDIRYEKERRGMEKKRGKEEEDQRVEDKESWVCIIHTSCSQVSGCL